MKKCTKTLFLLLSLIIIILGISCFASAIVKTPVAIDFEPVGGAINIYENQTSGGNYSFGRAYEPDLFDNSLLGSKLTVEYSDGSKTVYVLAHFAEVVKARLFDEKEEDYLQERNVYVDPDGNEIDHDLSVDIKAQENDLIKSGKDNRLVVQYNCGYDETADTDVYLKADVDVNFIQAPKSISFKPARKVSFIQQAQFGTGYVEYMDGSVLTVKNKDGSTYKLTCKLFLDPSRDNYYDDINRQEKHGYYFLDENGDVYPVVPYFSAPEMVKNKWYGKINFFGCSYSYQLTDITNKIKSIKYTPAKTITLKEGIDGETVNYDYINIDDAVSKATPEWFRYNYTLHTTGSTLKVTFTDGTSKTYKFYQIKEFGRYGISVKDESRFYLIDDNGDTIIYNAMYHDDNQHYASPWHVGTNYIVMHYGSATCKIPVTVKYNSKTHKVHVWDSGKITKKPTYTATGVKTFTCTACKKTKTEKVAKLKIPSVAAVTGLKVSKTTSSSVTLTWKKAKNATKYQIYRSVNGEGWKKAGATTKLTFTDKKLKAATDYKYKVRAVHTASKAKGSFSSAVTVLTLTDSPQIKKLASKKAGRVYVEWGKVEGAKYYIVYKSTDGKNWTKAIQVKTLACNVLDLPKGKKVYFRVAAVNNESKPSAPGSAKSIVVKE